MPHRIATLFIFFTTVLSTQTALAASPQITSIKGYTDGVGVTDGRWNGQPSAPTSDGLKSVQGISCDRFLQLREHQRQSVLLGHQRIKFRLSSRFSFNRTKPQPIYFHYDR